MKVAFFDSKPYDKESFNSGKFPGMEINYFDSKLNMKTASLTKSYDCVCVFVNDQVSREVIDVLVENGIKLIALRCAGYNNVDLNYIYKKIHVVRVPAYSPYAVAEHAAALILSLNRKTHRAYFRTRDGNFNINGLLGFDLNGKNAGVIGTGKIGKILIKILNGFGMNVFAYDAFPDNKAAEDLNYKYIDLDEIYKISDVISLHCPLNKETFHLINSESISKMKKNVMIINTSRGGLIDTKALLEALKNGGIASAGLDVYEEESEYFFEDKSLNVIDDDVLARLLTFPNVLVTSHQAFFTKEALDNIAETTIKNIKSFFNNEALENEICYDCGETYCAKKEKGRCF